jgi:hypothetical protein
MNIPWFSKLMHKRFFGGGRVVFQLTRWKKSVQAGGDVGCWYVGVMTKSMLIIRPSIS